MRAIQITDSKQVWAERDLAADLLHAIEEMKAGKGRVVWPLALTARQETGLSQVQFAKLLGVSVRTLQVDTAPR